MKTIRNRFITALATGALALGLLAVPCISYAADTPAATTKPAATTAKAGTPTAATGEMTYEQARAIALKDAGLEGKEVTWFETQKNKDKKTKVESWELGLFLGDTEYDYSINTATGEIIEKSSEVMDAEDKKENEQQAKTLDTILTKNTEYAVTADQALDIALKDAGIDITAAEVLKNNLENEDNLIVYKVEFTSAGMEYEYEIDANTGAITEKDSESLKNDD